MRLLNSGHYRKVSQVVAIRRRLLLTVFIIFQGKEIKDHQHSMDCDDERRSSSSLSSTEWEDQVTTVLFLSNTFLFIFPILSKVILWLMACVANTQKLNRKIGKRRKTNFGWTLATGFSEPRRPRGGSNESLAFFSFEPN